MIEIKINWYDGLLVKFTRLKNDDDFYEFIKDEDFVSKYLKLTNGERNTFHSLANLLKQVYKTNQKETDFLEKYDELYINLINKCQNNKLNQDEQKYLLDILSWQLINNHYVSYDLISMYLNNYFFKGNHLMIPEEAIVLNSYFLNFINQVTNSNIKLNYSYVAGGFGAFDLVSNTIEFSSKYYETLLTFDKLPKKDFYYFIACQAYSMIHEFAHFKQFTTAFQEFDSENVTRIQKEIAITRLNPSFYEKYMKNFYVEIEANKYASDYIESALKGVMPPMILNASLQRLFSDIQKSYKTRMKDEKFQTILDDEYGKISNVLEERLNINNNGRK